MLGKFGLENVTAIRALPGNGANVPIIALTGRASDEDKANYRERPAKPPYR